jgi:hypothetical protein
VPTPVTSPPYPTQFKFRNDGTAPLYLHEGCVGVDYGISSCASGFRDSLGPAFHCGCDCESTTCTHGLSCGACPAPVGGVVAPGASVDVSWDAIARSDEQRTGYVCVHSQPASPGRHRVAVRVYDDEASARDGIGGRLVTQDFELPAAGGVVEVAIATVASDACTAAPTAATPACTGGEAHDQPCRLTLSMNYASEGGLGPYYDASALAPPNAFTLMRTYNNSTLSAQTCAAALPICSRDARDVTTGDVTRVLSVPSVVAAFATPTAVFGYDSRPVDGRILVLRSPDGKSLGIGDNRPDTPVPQALLDVRTAFNQLDVQMRATPACAALNK